MLLAPDTHPIDRPPLKSTLSMPYTLTPGRAAGVFLAEAKNRRLVGARCVSSGLVSVPAQDFCPATGGSEMELVEAPETGTITGFTQTAAGIIATLRIDGADFDCVHRILEASFDELEIGARVEAVWAEETTQSILAVVGFRLAPGAPVGEVRPLQHAAEPLPMVPYHLDLHYEHAFGPFYGRMFDEIGTNRRLIGVRSTAIDGALLPPREVDDISYTKTGTWMTVPDTGTVRAMSVIHLEFKGQKEKPPYIYAEIQLDGAVTRLIHSVKGIDMSRASELVKPGTRVRAVWSDARTGALSDISHFEPVPDGDEAASL
ncbi:Zn-ribbon domain-containing OB-fold protein [Enterovirga aerilata]|uniref:ChsH2 C-terminal OB-fold domain-containing protein n=1 Tax=Enterovirga aerilata TaxID=2730920 RepID=A0A849ID26_9HYPH|nr:OB-fold domain-containing protein [Enterovirga sp. DB1703]NNM74135.1 hypothetical protein [Enterovirga sp. DB1703]